MQKRVNERQGENGSNGQCPSVLETSGRAPERDSAPLGATHLVTDQLIPKVRFAEHIDERQQHARRNDLSREHQHGLALFIFGEQDFEQRLYHSRAEVGLYGWQRIGKGGYREGRVEMLVV